MKKFLFLDDTEERHEHFNELCQGLGVEVWHVRTAREAIGRLNKTRFDTVWLDHDLEDTDRENTGFIVAKYIAIHLPVDKQPGFVVIHSWNPDGALDMAIVPARQRFQERKEGSFFIQGVV
jgi:CheY-like chemotaxis protein